MFERASLLPIVCVCFRVFLCWLFLACLAGCFFLLLAEWLVLGTFDMLAYGSARQSLCRTVFRCCLACSRLMRKRCWLPRVPLRAALAGLLVHVFGWVYI